MDIASLGFKIDSSQAVSATSHLDQMAAASMRMQQQIQQQQRQIDEANRIIATYSTNVAQGTAAIGNLTAELAKQTTVMAQYTQGVGVMGDRINQLTDATKKLREAQFQAFDSALGRLVEENTARIQALGAAFRDTARQMGVSATELKDFNTYTAGLGLSATASTNALGILTKTINDQSQATQGQRAVLQAYGVSLTDTMGKAKGASDVLAELVKRMQDVADGPRKNSALATFGISSVDDLRAIADATSNQIKLTRDLQNVEDQRFANYSNWVKRQVKENQDAAAEVQRLEKQKEARASTLQSASWAGGLGGGILTAIGNQVAPNWMDENLAKPLDTALNNIRKEFQEFGRDLAYMQKEAEVELSKSTGGLLNTAVIGLSKLDTILRDMSYRTTKLLAGEEFAQANQGGFFGTQYKRPEAPVGQEAPIPFTAFELQQQARYDASSRASALQSGPNSRAAIAGAQIPNFIADQVNRGAIPPEAAPRATDAERVAQSAALVSTYLQQTAALEQKADVEKRLLSYAQETPIIIAYQRAYEQAVEATKDAELLLLDVREKGSDRAKIKAQEALDAMEAYRKMVGQTAQEALVAQQKMAAGAETVTGAIQLRAAEEKVGLAGLSPSERARRSAEIDARAGVETQYSALSAADRDPIAANRARIASTNMSAGQRAAASDQMRGLNMQRGFADLGIRAAGVSSQEMERVSIMGAASQSAMGNDAINAAAVAQANLEIATKNRTAASVAALRQAKEESVATLALIPAYAGAGDSIEYVNAKMRVGAEVRGNNINLVNQEIMILADLAKATSANLAQSALAVRTGAEQNEILAKTAGLTGGIATATAERLRLEQDAAKKMLALQNELKQATDTGDQEAIKNAQVKADKQDELNAQLAEQLKITQELGQVSRDSAATAASNNALEIAQKELELVGQTVEVRQRELSVLRQIQQARGESTDGSISSGRADAIRRNADAAAISAKAQEAQQTIDRMVTRFGDGTADAIVNAFAEGARKGESIWTSLVGSMRSILLRGLSEVLSSQVFQPLFRNVVSGFAGSFISGSSGGGISGGGSGIAGGAGRSSSGGFGITDIFGLAKSSGGGGGMFSGITNSINDWGARNFGFASPLNSSITATGSTSAPAFASTFMDNGLGGVANGVSTGGSGALSGVSFTQGLGAAAGVLGGGFQIAQGGAGNVVGGASSIAAGLMSLSTVAGPYAPLVAIGGQLIGSLLGNKKPSVGPGGGAEFGVGADGKAIIGITNGDNGYDAVAQNLEPANAVGLAAKTFAEGLGGVYKGTAIDTKGGYLGSNTKKGTFSGGDSFGSPETGFNPEVKTLGEASAAALLGVLKNSVIEGLSKDLSDRLKAATTTQDLEGLLVYTEQLKATVKAFKDWKEPMTQVEVAMKGLNDAFEVGKKAAESLSKPLTEVSKGYDAQVAYLTKNFNQPLQDRFMAASGDNAALQIVQREREYAALRKDAAFIGQQAVLQVEKTIAAERGRIQRDQATAQASTALNLIQNRYQELVSELQQAQQAQVSGLTQTRDLWLSIVRGLQQFKDSLLVGRLSPLSPLEQMTTAQRQFTNALAKAKGGDTEAAGQVQGLAQQALEQTQSYYASGKDYADYFQSVQNMLTDFQSTAQMEADKATSQLTAMLGVQKNTRDIATIAAEIAETIRMAGNAQRNVVNQAAGSATAGSAIFDAYTKYLGRDPDSEGAIYWGNQVGTGARTISQTTAEIQNSKEAQLYQTYNSLLGRRPDEAGAAYWSSIMAGGASITDVQNAIRNSPEYLALPKKASGGYHSGGWRMVGEHGAEMEWTPPSYIYNASQTHGMMANDNNATLKSSFDALSRKLDQLIVIMAEAGDGNNGRLEALHSSMEDTRRILANSSIAA